RGPCGGPRPCGRRAGSGCCRRRSGRKPRNRWTALSAVLSQPWCPTRRKDPVLMRPVEEILGGVRHPHHLVGEVAGIGGGLAAHGVHPLDEGLLVENTRP